MQDRRTVIIGAGAAMGAALFASRGFTDAPARDDAVLEVTKGAGITPGRVTLNVPAVAENGLSVLVSIAADSPATPADRVRTIHLFSGRNPVAKIASFHFGPRTAQAQVTTTIRLAGSQELTALAETDDGRFFSDSKRIVVTVAACVEGG